MGIFGQTLANENGLAYENELARTRILYDKR